MSLRAFYQGNLSDEKIMIVVESYAQAAHDVIGFLNVKAALALSQNHNSRNRSSRFAEEGLKFIDEYQRGKIPISGEEKKSLVELKEILEKIKRYEPEKVDVEYGLYLLNGITSIKERFHKEEEKYRSIFKRY